MAEQEPPREERPYRTGGYNRTPREGRTYDRPQQRVVEFLPHPDVLESYNYVVEGSAKMILSMFEMEQKHRHEWERVALNIHRFSSMLGQLLGFLIAISIFVSVTVLGIYGNGTLAASIWIFGVGIVVMAGMVWLYAKSMGQRPLFARPTMRTHFRPVKAKDQPAEGGEGSG